MLLLDVTIVNVALPSIQRGLHTTLTDLEWVVDAYTLTLAAFLSSPGRLPTGWVVGRVFRAGITIFTLGSLLCSVATNATFLIVSRVVQGLGGAALFATALAILGQEFEGRQRIRALSIWGAAVGGGLAVGPLAGGVLTQYINWRAIFFVNVPIGAAVLIASGLRLGESTDSDQARMDWSGAAGFGSALTLLVFALLEGERRDGPTRSSSPAWRRPACWESPLSETSTNQVHSSTLASSANPCSNVRGLSALQAGGRVSQPGSIVSTRGDHKRGPASGRCPFTGGPGSIAATGGLSRALAAALHRNRPLFRQSSAPRRHPAFMP